MPAATAECSGVALQISMHEFPQADVNAAASAHLGVQGALEHATPAMQRTLQGGVLKESEQQVLQEPSPHICRPAPLVGRNAAGCSQALGPSSSLLLATSACRCEQAHASTHSRALSVASTAAAVHQASASQPACQAPSHPACPPTSGHLHFPLPQTNWQVAGAHLAAGSTIVVVLQKMPRSGPNPWKQAQNLP